MNISELIEAGESQTLEMKSRITNPNMLAKVISSLANTEGGTILVGVKESGDAVGINTSKLDNQYQQALSQLSGSSESSFKTVEYNGKNVGLIQVDKSEDVVGTKEGYFQRVSDIDRPFGPEELKSLFLNKEDTSNSIEKLTETVANQSNELGKLRESFDTVNSWKRKLFYALLGALATAIVKLAFTAFGL